MRCSRRWAAGERASQREEGRSIQPVSAADAKIVWEIGMFQGSVRVACACMAALVVLALAAGGARAGEADVLEVKVDCKEGKCRFLAKVHHADGGWKHYASRWEVLDLGGNVLTTRVLTHPHVNE